MFGNIRAKLDELKSVDAEAVANALKPGIPTVVEMLFEMSLGLREAEKVTRDGAIVKYRLPPSAWATQMILERAYGRPAEGGVKENSDQVGQFLMSFFAGIGAGEAKKFLEGTGQSLPEAAVVEGEPICP